MGAQGGITIDRSDRFIIIVNQIIHSIEIYNEESKISRLELSFADFGSFGGKLLPGFAIELLLLSIVLEAQVEVQRNHRSVLLLADIALHMFSVTLNFF